MSPVIDRIGPPAGGPLEGVRILDIGSLIAGPFTATLLAELGADVVKVEQPSGDSSRAFGPSKDGTNVYWKTIGRNKRSISSTQNWAHVRSPTIRARWTCCAGPFRQNTIPCDES